MTLLHEPDRVASWEASCPGRARMLSAKGMTLMTLLTLRPELYGGMVDEYKTTSLDEFQLRPMLGALQGVF